MFKLPLLERTYLEELPDINVPGNGTEYIPCIQDGLDKACSLDSLMQASFPNVLYYGADPTGVADSTQAFVDALTENQSVYIPWRSDFTNYRIGDLSFAGLDGRKLWSLGTTSYITTVGSHPLIKKKTGTVTNIFDTYGADGITLEGFRIDGFDRSANGIGTGGDNITLRDLSVTVCRWGYGQTAHYSQTSQLINCWFGNNVIGIRDIVDTTILGGSVFANKTCGIYLNTGASFNNINTRAEFNGNGGGAFTDGNNIFMHGADDNIICGNIDASYLAGVVIDGCSNVVGQLMLRRNGRSNSSSAGENSHLVVKGGSNNINLRIETKKGVEDDGSGPTTPKYCVAFDEQTSNRSVNISGGWEGFVTNPTIFLSGASNVSPSSTVKLTGPGAPKTPLISSSIAASGSAIISIRVPLNYGQNRRYAAKLAVTVRDETSFTTNYQVEFPLLVRRDSLTNDITFGAAGNEIGSAGYIQFGGGTMSLAAGALVETSTGYLTIPITCTNGDVNAVTVFMEAIL